MAKGRLFNRPPAVSWLKRWQDRDVIKVVTGIRRCGKSSVLKLMQEELLAQGVPPNAIISIDLEQLAFEAPSTPKGLFDLVISRLPPAEETSYVFLDEVQRVPEFERAVDALYARGGIDLYITGSNSDLLSSEIATLLTGRHVEYRMLPLSFAEYAQALDLAADDTLFNRYLVHGGFPYTAQLPEEDVSEYLDGVLNTIMVKDVSLRHPRFNMNVLRSLISFMADNIGNRFSLKTIAGSLANHGVKISPTTVGEYLEALVEAYVLFKAPLYDAKGRELLTSSGKYYLGDLGFRHVLLGRDQADMGHRVENIVYLELLRRYRTVYVGRIGSREIDFIVEDGGVPRYYQVALTVLDEATLKRELSPLQALPNNYQKTLLTLDRIGTGDHGGIMQRNLIDWLANEE